MISTAYTDPTTCDGTEGTITISGLALSTVYEVSYSLDGGTAVVGSYTSDASGEVVITGLEDGAYTDIFVTNSNCTSNFETATLTDPTPPDAPSVTYEDSYCFNDIGVWTDVVLTANLDETLFLARWYTLDNLSNIGDGMSYEAQINEFYPATDVGEHTYFVTTVSIDTECESLDYTTVTYNIYENPEFNYQDLDVFGSIDSYPFSVVDLNVYQIEMEDTAQDYFYNVINNDTGENLSVSSDGVFQITETGEYTIEAINSDHLCSNSDIVEIEFLEIEIPNVFNPGGPNEEITTWYPINLGYESEGDFSAYTYYSNMEVMIFDRYGRLLKEYDGVRDRGIGQGWDGTYNGKPLPTGDYWYHIIVNDNNQSEYTGHFTLYRN